MKIFSVFILFSMVQLSGSVAAQVAPNQGNVSARSIRVDMRDATFVELIGFLAVSHKVPTGFQEQSGGQSPVCESERSVSFPNGVRLGAFMSFVMDECPGLAWKDGKVLSISPSTPEKSVLNVSMARFSADNLTAVQTLDRIFEQAEVKKYLAANKLARLKPAPLSSVVLDPSKYSFSASNSTVREVLDQIVLTTKYKIWIHQGPTDGKITISLF